jgi:hypothetical protein
MALRSLFHDQPLVKEIIMTKQKSKIPIFKTIQEEAEFWDTHDTMDFIEEFTPVKVKFDLTPAPSPRNDPIPQNVSRKELAKFWDTHSIADYQDELKPISIDFSNSE